MKIVLLGLPGAGKGTQAEKLSQYFHIPKITVGDIYRKIAKEDTEFGRKIKEILDRGEMVPDEITNEIIGERIRNLDGWILDGYPRSMKQLTFLEEHSPDYIAIFIDAKKDEIVKRLSARRICPTCGSVYNMISKPPKHDEICDKCGAKLVQRDDDKPELVRKRIEVQEEKLMQMVNFYEQRGKLIKVNGNQDIDRVFEEIVEKLREKMLEKTFVMIKPDGVERNLIGEIIKRFEEAGLKIVALKMIKLSEDIVVKHYPDSMAKSIAEKAKKAMGDIGMTPEEYGQMVLKGLREYITSGPVVCMVIEGENAINKVREITGFTDPSRAKPGTIRGDLGNDSFEKANAEMRSVRNLIHASDSPETAKAEIKRFFSELEIFER